MKKWGWILCLVLAACTGGQEASPSAENASPGIGGTVQASVTRTIDGDTIEVAIGGRKETVRMILVDTPEIRKPGLQEPQPFGPEAAAYTRKLLAGKKVQLERDVSATDAYGRSLYYVWLDGKLVNRLLLEEGLARVAVFPPDVKYVEDFRSAAAEAQAGGKGIWSVENYVTDRGFREPSAPAVSSPKPSSSHRR